MLVYLVLSLTGFAAGFIDTIAGGGGMITAGLSHGRAAAALGFRYQ
jgi:hypothetical protein